jgi:hypothetical protein
VYRVDADLPEHHPTRPLGTRRRTSVTSASGARQRTTPSCLPVLCVTSRATSTARGTGAGLLHPHADRHKSYYSGADGLSAALAARLAARVP